MSVMDMKTIEELRDEIEVVTLGRDLFRSLRCTRKDARVSLALIAGREETVFQRRLDALLREAAKAAKSAAAKFAKEVA
jgi:hypothetical protein